MKKLSLKVFPDVHTAGVRAVKNRVLSKKLTTTRPKGHEKCLHAF